MNKPVTLRIPENEADSGQRLLILFNDVVEVSAEPLRKVNEFADDGRGGFIAPAAGDSGLWGYINQHATWVVPPAFAEARTFSDEGVARFK